MKRNVMICALAGAAIAMSAPALAAPGGNGGGHGNAGGSVGGTMGAGPVSAGGMGAGSMTSGMDRATTATSGNANASAGFGSAMDMRASAQTRRDTARANSQGPAHANVNGLTHANEHSVLSTAGVTTLTGLAAGATVSNATGTLGTVDSVVTNKNGAVVGINVTLTSGGTVFIPATTLTMNGTAVTTTFVPHG